MVGTIVHGIVLFASFVLFVMNRVKVAVALLALAWLTFVFPAAGYIITDLDITCKATVEILALNIYFSMTALLMSISIAVMLIALSK